jgi:BirA family transcriptional regulator, biotin operon repressor / biotin---[acetyl-CoA-carboxylase] ligase
MQPGVHRLTQVSSTLDVLHAYATRGAPHGTVVVAEEQLQGRGTRGRTWHSPPGGLWFSILYRDIGEPAIEVLSLRVGLAVVATVESVVPGIRLGLKWPNDVMLGERKLGGVLCEARWHGAMLEWIAVGLGLNLANPVPTGLEATAVSLASSGPGVPPGDLVAPLTAALRDLSLGPAGLSPEELALFRGRDWLQGRVLRAPVPGIARGVAADGTLLMEQPDGSMTPVRAGHVVLG